MSQARDMEPSELVEPEAPQFVPTGTNWPLRPHDLIDPWHPDQHIDKVYPILLTQLG